MKPTQVTVLGIPYQIQYVQNASEVDIHKRRSLWGQVDFWTHTIRIFDDGTRNVQVLWQNIIHEIMHGIATELHLKVQNGGLDDEGLNENSMDCLALAFTDVLFRNGWINVDYEEELTAPGAGARGRGTL